MKSKQKAVLESICNEFPDGQYPEFHFASPTTWHNKGIPPELCPPYSAGQLEILDCIKRASKSGRYPMWRIDFSWPAERLGIEYEGIGAGYQEPIGRTMNRINFWSIAKQSMRRAETALNSSLVRSRHTGVAGFSKDCEKYNTAICFLGWRIFRVTAKMLDSGKTIDQIRFIIKNR